MIELSLSGEPRVVCDVCRDQIADAGLAVVLRGPGAAAVFAHKCSCQGAAERFLANGTYGWTELVDFVDELRVALQDEHKAAERNCGRRPSGLLRRVAEVAEAAYRRGFQQGHDVCRRGDRLAVDLDAWRYGIPIDRAPSPTGDRPTTAVDRLEVHHPELVTDLLAGADPRDKQARGRVGRRGFTMRRKR